MPEIVVNDSLVAHADALSEAAGNLTEGITPLSPGRQKNRPADETIEASERFAQVLSMISSSAAVDMLRLKELYNEFAAQDEELSRGFGGKENE